MKKGFVKFVLLGFILLVALIFVYLRIKNPNSPTVPNTPLNGVTNSTDYKIAQTIPRYPNATSWKVTASNGFPDGSPSGEINFETNDSADNVIAFYREKMKNDGWEVKFESNLVDGAGKKLPGKYIGFKKNDDTAELTWYAKSQDDRNYNFSIRRVKS